VTPNLDLVRSIYADWERGDYSFTEWAHAAIEFVYADGPEPGSWAGLAEMSDAARDRLTAWAELRVEVDEYRELDDERVLVFVRRSGRGKTSGLELGHFETRGATLFHIRDGKVTRIVNYYYRDRALADLGRAPDAASPGS
jgi:ketosteroid isomerase-like protein